jgi:hypothetical protein
MNIKQNAVKKSKAQEKSLKIREEYWPKLKDDDIWDRKKHKGFTTIPRTIAIVMSILDSLSKGKPLGQTYFVLWCHVFDDSILIIENPSTYVAEAGFTGERALTTWNSRMKALQDLGFIDCKDGASGKFHYVLIKNPHKVMWQLKNKIQEKRFRQLLDRALDIGAKDMSDGKPKT